MKRLYTLFCILFLALCPILSAQSTSSSSAPSGDDDFGIWAVVGLKNRLTEKFTLKTDLEVKSKNNSQSFEVALFTIELSYKFNKYFSAAAAIVPYFSGNGSGTDTKLRYYLFATGSLPLGNFKIDLREKFQQSFSEGAELSSSKGNPVTLLRSRLQMTYKIPDTSMVPTASIEPALRLFCPGSQIINYIRYTVGVKFNVGSHHDIFPFYRYQQKFDIGSRSTHILGLHYHYTF